MRAGNIHDPAPFAVTIAASHVSSEAGGSGLEAQASARMSNETSLPSPIATLALALALAGCGAAPPRPPAPADGLRGVQRWAIQLQGVEDALAIERLVAARLDMVVIEPVRSVRGKGGEPVRERVARIRASRGAVLSNKLCVAYLNIGQAEDYRAYWLGDWRAPTRSAPGAPAFLLGADPDGWVGNYPVAYWDGRWQATLFGSPEAPLDQILADGFDGAYLDWVLGYAHSDVVAAARRDGVDPAREMVELIARLRAHARARRPEFVLIAQNGADLPQAQPGLLDVIDGLAQEDLSFRGAAAAKWDDRSSGDAPATAAGPWSTAELGRRLARLAAGGLPVFTIDYAREPDNIARAAATSRAFGLVPFVSRTPLDRLPEHVFEAAPPR
jgi:cysteinyl-tRNA synthetase